nr:MAG TPA_asm: hypothetical protein [Caudoviricetes sp.]
MAEESQIRQNEPEGRCKPLGTDGQWKISMPRTAEVRG